MGELRLVSEDEPSYAKGTEEWAEHIREEARQLAVDLDVAYLKVAEYIWLIYDTPINNDPGKRTFYQSWGYYTVEQWARHELGISERRVQYLRQIYYTMNVELLGGGVPQDVVDKLLQLGYSKLRVMCGVLTAANAQEWAERTDGFTYRQIEETVQKYRLLCDAAKSAEQDGVGVPDPVPPATVADTDKVSFRRFVLSPESNELVDEAMRTAAAVSNSDNESYLLSLICLDFLATNGGAAPGTESFRAYLANLERLLQVRLVALDFQSPPGEDVLFGLQSLLDVAARHKVVGE